MMTDHTELVHRLKFPSRSGESKPPSVDPNRPLFPASFPAAGQKDAEPERPPGRLTIRPVAAVDLTVLGRLAVMPLQQPELSLDAYRPVAIASRVVLPLTRSSSQFLVARTDGSLIGFVHFEPILPDRRWQLQALGSSTGVYDPQPVWRDLLVAGTKQAGLAGVKRLFARAAPDSGPESALREAGFTAYAEETIYLADDPMPPKGAGRFVQQEESDTWAIHQLYNCTVPRDVLTAEARTSHHWDIEPRRLRASTVTTGWMAGDRQAPHAYLRLTHRHELCAGDIIFLPGAAQEAIGLIDGVLREVRRRQRVRRVYLVLRSYQQELGERLLARGYWPAAEQRLFVKYTTAPARIPIPERASLPRDLGEAVPSRVPTAMHDVNGHLR